MEHLVSITVFDGSSLMNWNSWKVAMQCSTNIRWAGSGNHLDNIFSWRRDSLLPCRPTFLSLTRDTVFFNTRFHAESSLASFLKDQKSVPVISSHSTPPYFNGFDICELISRGFFSSLFPRFEISNGQDK